MSGSEGGAEPGGEGCGLRRWRETTFGHLGEMGGEGYVGVGFEICRQLVVEPGWMGQFGRAHSTAKGTR